MPASCSYIQAALGGKIAESEAKHAEFIDDLIVDAYIHPGGGLILQTNFTHLQRQKVVQILIQETMREQKQIDRELQAMEDNAQMAGFSDLTILNDEQLVAFAAGIPGAPGDQMTPAMKFPKFPVVSPVAQVRGFVSDRELGAEFRAAGVRKGDELAACPGRVCELEGSLCRNVECAYTRRVPPFELRKRKP
jgi:hypothetical protein